ncbi:hypothetical protein [Marinobacter lutaoensis]|jgi:hypothetical protein|uniref:Multidrug transporter n=1 Tax=Marinobacter lutaoensis TaxID=135739 RepID=A0A1V2DPD0_9GAMM|nr:hypothetical protein [Marinobacter lutaoensis]MBE02300.1 hypothetical protein [Marinobacter sp.]MBI43808.1 hypothetical protein [Oceanospirillales bacterium]NVD35670.1 hypothetical protein [Marinobacter lutaoensis]ONF42256.1 hypothetical protein BTO32_16965 [Marinobacter lutaoensis]|tara:strand:+ start:2363 stop:2692 length:330 start_codon:yes stop_codon:yes gene_type:complete
MTRKIYRTLMATMAACLLAFSSLGHAQAIDETPSALAMAGDALFVRPVLLATTLVGGAIYLVSLPFSALGGNAAEAGEVLVVGPAKATFVRCLGCSRTGRKQDTVETDQ